MTPITSTEHFQTAIAVPTPTLALFGSPTCPWCKRQKPVIEAFGTKYPRIATLFVDADAFPEIMARRRIATIPTLVLYVAGKARGKAEGFHTAAEVEKWAEGALP